MYLLPPFFWLTQRWRKQAAAASAARAPSALRLTLLYLGAVFGVGLGGAAVCALAVRGVAHALGVGDHIARAATW